MNYFPLKITEASEYALYLLTSSSCWKLHSSYRKTVNLTDGKHIIALQTAGSPISPLSLITDTADITDIFSHNQQYTSKMFSCCNTVIYNDILSPITGLTNHDVSALLNEISQAINTGETNGFDLIFKCTPDSQEQIKNDLLLTAAQNIILSAEECFSHSIAENDNWESGATKLSALTGIGIGLTPSGDDFLTGVLAGLILTDRTDHPFCQQLKKILPKQLHRTNEISAAFIKCAIDGRFSQHIHNINNHATAHQLLSDFNKVGHSSGIDTLCGIYWIVKQFA